MRFIGRKIHLFCGQLKPSEPISCQAHPRSAASSSGSWVSLKIGDPQMLKTSCSYENLPKWSFWGNTACSDTPWHTHFILPDLPIPPWFSRDPLHGFGAPRLQEASQGIRQQRVLLRDGQVSKPWPKRWISPTGKWVKMVVAAFWFSVLAYWKRRSHSEIEKKTRYRWGKSRAKSSMPGLQDLVKATFCRLKSLIPFLQASKW